MFAAVVLVLLLVFILQNTASVKVSYFGASGHLPLGVALMLSAVAGLLLAALVASLRIVQIRRRLGDGPGRLGDRLRHRAGVSGGGQELAAPGTRPSAQEAPPGTATRDP